MFCIYVSCANGLGQQMMVGLHVLRYVEDNAGWRKDAARPKADL